MADKSGISWTEATWNFLTGCDKVSPACKFCYAERDWARLAKDSRTVYFGRKFTDVAVHPERLDQPLRWTRSRMIFVNSMSDLFHKDVPVDVIDRGFAVMALCEAAKKGHVFQILTKREDLMKRYLNDPGVAERVRLATAEFNRGVALETTSWPLQNVWVGVSVENQEQADKRIPVLLETMAAVRWISAEPLLGPIDTLHIPGIGRHWDWLTGEKVTAMEKTTTAKIDWVVVGGESGPKARPMKGEWAIKLYLRCKMAGTPFFYKQWGEWIDAASFNGDITGLPTFKWDDGMESVRAGVNVTGDLLMGEERKAWAR